MELSPSSCLYLLPGARFRVLRNCFHHSLKKKTNVTASRKQFCVWHSKISSRVLTSFLALTPFVVVSFVNTLTSPTFICLPRPSHSSFYLMCLLLTWQYIKILFLLSQVLLSYSVNIPRKGSCFL